jgi:hypothetical protein
MKVLSFAQVLMRDKMKLLYTHLVIIIYEGKPVVTGFNNYEDAREFFENASLQWSDSFLCTVLKGPFNLTCI